jgi:hypothetical protein
MALTTEALIKKWGPVLDREGLNKITDPHKRWVTASVLEETANAVRREAEAQKPGSGFLTESEPINVTADVAKFDPVLISLVRRAMPNLIAYDICGVQPMSGPTGLIFAMRSQYANSSNVQLAETFYNEVNTAFSTLVAGTNTFGQQMVGVTPTSANNLGTNTYNTGTGMATANAEGLGQSTAFPEMGFTIEKLTVTALSRALKAEYSIELAQDLKAIHGLDAETELSNILSAEVLAEINREIVRTINIIARSGAQENTTTAGFFDLDTDSNGRWAVEKFKGLAYQIERECNQIAKGTRRGKGNLLLCSSDIASALQMTGVLKNDSNMANGLQVDDTGNTFCGLLNGKIRVYIDPYSTAFNLNGTVTDGQYFTAGYKGPSPFDAGLFYCPYVPLQMVRSVDPSTFQPKIGFKTRYGVIANPFAEGLNPGLGELAQDTNVYYRRVIVENLM